MPGYTKSEILERLANATADMSTLYQQDFVNYRGKTTDTNEPYTEVVAAYLLDNIALLSNIKTITRNSSYKIDKHDGRIHTPDSNREEEIRALNMFNKSYDHIGEIIGYQIPLKNVRADNGTGKIDLLSKIDNTLIILELKKEESIETLLRCVLEAITYWNIIDKEKLLSDYNLAPETVIRKAVFVFADKAQHNEFKIIGTYVRKLMTQLGVEIYLIKGSKTQADSVIMPF